MILTSKSRIWCCNNWTRRKTSYPNCKQSLNIKITKVLPFQKGQKMRALIKQQEC